MLAVVQIDHRASPNLRPIPALMGRQEAAHATLSARCLRLPPRPGLAKSTPSQLTRRGLRSKHLQIIAVGITDSMRAELLTSRHAARIRFLLYGVASHLRCAAAVGSITRRIDSTRSLAIAGHTMIIGWGSLLDVLFGCMVDSAVIWPPLKNNAEENVMLIAKTNSVQETAIARQLLKACAEFA